jgi:hypothetical protein
MDKRTGPVAEMSLERGEILLTFNLQSKQYQNNKIFLANRMKFSHINTREIHPDLAKRASPASI